MAGMQFEYDEKGGTFYYFLLSFMALVIVPATYYLWPSSKAKGEDPEKKKDECQCDPCLKKEKWLKSKEPWIKQKRIAIKLGLIIGWILLAVVAHKAMHIELELTEFDPYAILGLDPGATVKEVKKQYRQLSMTHHPDKGGDEKVFMKIAKAHAALTDPESMENWAKYGNPDGPGATHFGIALPAWIVEKDNSVWVLAVYGLVFMIILPTVVGTWWYNSIKFSSEQILMDTMNMYTYFFQKTPNMVVKRVISILGSSFEFDKRHCSDVVERPSDNVDLPRLMRDLPHFKHDVKNRPFCIPYSVKAQLMLHAHFMREDLPEKTLELDQLFVIQKCPYLINEMVKIVAQLVTFAKSGRCNMPRLETVENTMRASQMVIQGLWETKSPLLQLPHISEEMLRHFTTRKRNIRNIRDFASLDDVDRRGLLRTLSEQEYRDVVNVCARMPYINMSIRSEVLDDEDKSIAAGDIVTVFVKLTRHSMESKLFQGEAYVEPEKQEDESEPEDPDAEEVEEVGQNDTKATESPRREVVEVKSWEVNKRKKGKAGGGKNKKKPQQKVFIKKVVPKTTKKEEEAAQGDGTVSKTKPKSDEDSQDDADEESRAEESDVEEREESEAIDDEDDDGGDGPADGDDDEWMRLQEENQQKSMLDSKSKETHPVHCPYYPGKKYEWWWLYVADRKHHQLITAPLQVCSLRDEDEFQLKFCAPHKPGSYQYTVMLKSDSYLDFDLQTHIKVDVKEAKKVEDHPQWNLSEDEGEKDEHASDSDASTDYDSEDED